jgi:hypothetical protein
LRPHDQLGLQTQFVLPKQADGGMDNDWFLGVYVDFDIEELMMCIEIISFCWGIPPTKTR